MIGVAGIDVREIYVRSIAVGTKEQRLKEKGAQSCPWKGPEGRGVMMVGLHEGEAKRAACTVSGEGYQQGADRFAQMRRGG